MSSVISTVALLGSLAATVSAHGYVDGIYAATEFYQGFDISYHYMTNPPVVVGWTEDNTDNGYVSDYTSSDIICHKNATPAGTHAEINGGDKLDFLWNTWPESHKGPVITYLAKCDGECEDADKTTLKWFKIDQAAQIDTSSIPGTWATDNLIANNNSYTVTIPTSIASGNYVARHEIIALHSAGTEGGAQNYPYCINLNITSTGTDEPEGVLGTSLYTATDPGILVNIYASLSYEIPGPTLYSGAITSGASSTAAGSSAASSTAAASSAASSTAVASSAPATTSAPATSSAAATSAAVTTQAAAVTSSASAAGATSDVTDIVYATTAVTVTGSAPAVTATSAAASATGSSSTPSKSIPDGTTLQDLLSWITDLFNAETSSSKAKRAHARDISM